mmetsp:Transcript_23384/g.57957  ORF Transcript_23384/g.57957 Transcript_23384/m.57957 type:complete len:296 (+) Transcript_23384:547-1434(+)
MTSRARSTASDDPAATRWPGSACRSSCGRCAICSWSISLARSSRAWTFSWPLSVGLPAAIFMIAETTTSTSCATTSAARSAESSAKRPQRSSAGRITEGHTGRTPSRVRNSSGARHMTECAVTSTGADPGSRCATAPAIAACNSRGAMTSMAAEVTTSEGWKPRTPHGYTAGMGWCLTYSSGHGMRRMSHASMSRTWSWGSCSSDTAMPRSTPAMASANERSATYPRIESIPTALPSASAASSASGCMRSSCLTSVGITLDCNSARSKARAWFRYLVSTPSRLLSPGASCSPVEK